MKIQNGQEMPADLAAAKARFDQWRRSRSGKGRGRIPDELWRLAFELVGKHKISHVSRALGIGITDIRRKMSRTVKATASDPNQDVHSSIRVVEVSPAKYRTEPPSQHSAKRPTLIAELVTSAGVSIRMFSGIDADSLKILTQLL